MRNFLLNQINQCQSEEQNETAAVNNLISVKSLQTKFLPYVNQLNSSIQFFKRKTVKLSNNRDSQLFNDNVNKCFQTLQNSDDSRSKGSIKTHLEYKVREKRGKKSGSKNQIPSKISGKGTIELENGSVFKGSIQNGQLKEGILTMPSGVVYQGQFQDLRFHGPGSLKFLNGTYIKSTFQNGIMLNKGQIIYSNGEVYSGQICQFKKHGFGQLSFVNGKKYIGDFRNGDITGTGTYYINQFAVASGQWMNGQFLGDCCSVFQDKIIQEQKQLEKA